jgi:hypothetical protein
LLGTTSTASGTRSAKKIGIGWTNSAAVAMETKKGGFKMLLDSFHQTLWNLVGISYAMWSCAV